MTTSQYQEKTDLEVRVQSRPSPEELIAEAVAQMIQNQRRHEFAINSSSTTAHEKAAQNSAEEGR